MISVRTYFFFCIMLNSATRIAAGKRRFESFYFLKGLHILMYLLINIGLAPSSDLYSKLTIGPSPQWYDSEMIRHRCFSSAVCI